MAAGDGIKTALERNVKAVTLRPSVGQHTAVTRVRLGADLRCAIEEGPWKLAAATGETLYRAPRFARRRLGPSGLVGVARYRSLLGLVAFRHS